MKRVKKIEELIISIRNIALSIFCYSYARNVFFQESQYSEILFTLTIIAFLIGVICTMIAVPIIAKVNDPKKEYYYINHWQWQLAIVIMAICTLEIISFIL
jgi:amino acid transporter